MHKHYDSFESWFIGDETLPPGERIRYGWQVAELQVAAENPDWAYLIMSEMAALS